MRPPYEHQTPFDTLHKVTTDIYDDTERQNLTLDDTVRPGYPPHLFLGLKAFE